MKRVILISDLWGKRKMDWIKKYSDRLSQNYEVKIYDACELAQIDLSVYEEKAIHEQFVEFGIEKAVERLLALEENPALIIGFSVGGVIAWKAILEGMKATGFIGISATRLRYEKTKIDCEVKLFFGEEDGFRPSEDWFLSMGIVPEIVKGRGHEIYKEEEFVERVLGVYNT